MAVRKDGYDWLASCRECPESVCYCPDWFSAMEAAYGHLAMNRHNVAYVTS